MCLDFSEHKIMASSQTVTSAFPNLDQTQVKKEVEVHRRVDELPQPIIHSTLPQPIYIEVERVHRRVEELPQPKSRIEFESLSQSATRDAFMKWVDSVGGPDKLYEYWTREKSSEKEKTILS